MLIPKVFVALAWGVVFGLAIGLPLGWGFSQFHHSSQAPQIEVAQPPPATGPTYIQKEPDDSWVKWLDPVAVATFLLAVAAFLTAGIVAQQVVLARQEFRAGYPPELIMREVGFTTLRGEDRIVFTLVNRGRNPCEIVESEFIFQATPPSGRAVQTQGVNRIGPIRLAAGEFFTYSREMASAEEQFVGGARGWGLAECYFRSIIIYADDAKIRRRFVLNRQCIGGSDRFVPTGNPEDEYTD
jgi:hypothetical protein